MDRSSHTFQVHGNCNADSPRIIVDLIVLTGNAVNTKALINYDKPGASLAEREQNFVASTVRYQYAEPFVLTVPPWLVTKLKIKLDTVKSHLIVGPFDSHVTIGGVAEFRSWKIEMDVKLDIGMYYLAHKTLEDQENIVQLFQSFPIGTKLRVMGQIDEALQDAPLVGVTVTMTNGNVKRSTQL